MFLFSKPDDQFCPLPSSTSDWPVFFHRQTHKMHRTWKLTPVQGNQTIISFWFSFFWTIKEICLEIAERWKKEKEKVFSHPHWTFCKRPPLHATSKNWLDRISESSWDPQITTWDPLQMLPTWCKCSCLVRLQKGLFQHPTFVFKQQVITLKIIFGRQVISYGCATLVGEGGHITSVASSCNWHHWATRVTDGQSGTTFSWAMEHLTKLGSS